MIDLKPCPFCGGEAMIVEHTFYELNPTYGIYCKNCEAKTRQFYKTEEDAAEAWNRRANNDKK